MDDDLVDVPDDASLQELERRLNDAVRRCAGKCYALLDTTFTRKLMPDDYLAGPHEMRRLYEGFYSGERLEEADPQLIWLPAIGAEALAMLSRWCAGRPMLSFIVSRLDIDELLAHLRGQTAATGPDGDRYILRFGDTRCWPDLYGSFTDGQRARLMHGIDSWFYFDTAGCVQGLFDSTTPRAAYTPPFMLLPFKLSEAQMAETEDGVAWRLLSYIASRPEDYGRFAGRPSARHRAAMQAVAEAKVHGGVHDAVLLRRVCQALKADGLLETG